MLKRKLIILGLLAIFAAPLHAEVNIDGFLQGLYGARLEEDNPTATEMPASETRLQLRAEHFGNSAEFFGRLDFVYDAADTAQYEWELREGYLKFRLGQYFDFKIGRQVLTWGTGDLVFINDVFAKDYRSFFVGRDDQYLKAPQNALRMAFYPGFGNLNFVWTPRFEPNRLPTGRKLSYYNPFVGRIVGEGYYFDPATPEAKFENGEFALRYQQQIGMMNAALYFYKGFYKNPTGAVTTPDGPMAIYPHLNVYGASVRGSILGGILWLEGGYFDSRDDKDGDNPMMPNSSRITKLLNQELVTLSGFVFYSPTDEDMYVRASVEYKYTDQLILALGGNFFEGNNQATDFGQFDLNDNVYLKATYGF